MAAILAFTLKIYVPRNIWRPLFIICFSINITFIFRIFVIDSNYIQMLPSRDQIHPHKSDNLVSFQRSRCTTTMYSGTFISR